MTTPVLDPDDPCIASDAVFGVKASLLARFENVTEPACAAAGGTTEPSGTCATTSFRSRLERGPATTPSRARDG
jgi:hypothetical protein